MAQEDYLLKFILVGDHSVGKSSVISRFFDREFNSTQQMTIGVEFRSCTISIYHAQQQKQVKLNVWDTAGQDRFRSIIPQYYRGAHGVVIVYSVENRRSFEQVSYWFGEARNHGNPRHILLIANKSDLVDERVVSTEEGKDFAESHGMTFMETSALNNINIMEAFTALSAECLSHVCVFCSRVRQIVPRLC